MTEDELRGGHGARGPRTVAELRRALGDTPYLFVVGADDNPRSELRSCGDGTTVVWSETLLTGYPPRWFVDFSERGHDSSTSASATFLYEADACRYAWEKCFRP